MGSTVGNHSLLLQASLHRVCLASWKLALETENVESIQEKVPLPELQGLEHRRPGLPGFH